MTAYLHKEFGRFSFAFLATDDANVYRLKTYPKFTNDFLTLLPKDLKVRFCSATGVEDVSLPNPILLNVHCTLAEILHASGMGETIDQQMRDVENIGGLREDGSTNVAGLLAGAFGGRVTG
ncbi:hypothetical protein VTN96DRAFT_528 [Rasamsonia emersonii]